MKKIEGFSQFLTLKNDPENQNCAKFDLHFQSDLSKTTESFMAVFLEACH